MLARLQLLLLAATVLAALAWLAWALPAGVHAGWVAVGLLVALLPTAPVLAAALQPAERPAPLDLLP